jgi:small-conductance mechanosensitive channel
MMFRASLLALLLLFTAGLRLCPAAEPSPSLTQEPIDAAGSRIGDAVDAATHHTDWLQQELAPGLTLARVLTSAALLLALAIVLLVALRWARLWGGEIHTSAPRSWPRILLAAARKPLALVLVAQGCALALAPSLSAIADAAARATTLGLSSRIADLVSMAAWFWFTVRLALATEKKMERWARQSPGTWKALFVEMTGRVLKVSLPLLSAILLLPLLRLPPALETAAQKLVGIALIAGVAGLVIRSVLLFQRVVQSQYRIDVADNLEARKISTQVSVLAKLIISLVSVLALGSMLMVFDSVRQLGTSLLASAGIAGIVLGFAAQKTLGNLLAGIQIAISQPIRLDDVVIVEGEFGRVEEITLTYVVVRLWDLRRMVLPITYFLEKPFQNWTREGSKILGAVFFYLDYTAPVEAMRAELRRLVEGHPKWDGDVCGLQVTDSRENVVEIRCLASAQDAGRCFDLRCDIREGMLAFLREHHPDALPRVRAELTRKPVSS